MLAAAPNENSPPAPESAGLAALSPPNLNPPPLPNVGAGAAFSTGLVPGLGVSQDKQEVWSRGFFTMQVEQLQPGAGLNAEKSDLGGGESSTLAAGSGVGSFLAPNAKPPKVAAGAASDLEPNRGVVVAGEEADLSDENAPNTGAGASDFESDPKAPKLGLAAPELGEPKLKPEA